MLDQQIPIGREELVVRGHRAGLGAMKRALARALAVALCDGAARAVAQPIEALRERAPEPRVLADETRRIFVGVALAAPPPARPATPSPRSARRSKSVIVSPAASARGSNRVSTTTPWPHSGSPGSRAGACRRKGPPSSSDRVVSATIARRCAVPWRPSSSTHSHHRRAGVIPLKEMEAAAARVERAQAGEGPAAPWRSDRATGRGGAPAASPRGSASSRHGGRREG